jgi:ribosomal protein S15P/S13E
VEASLNYNFYTDRPIIGQGQEGLESELQFSPKHTMQMSMLLGESTGVSPLYYDNAIRELLGSTSAVINFFTENMIADMRGETLPDKTFREKLLMLPNFNSFLVKQYGARDMNDLYELSDEVNKAYKSYKKLEKYSVDEKGQKEFNEYVERKQKLLNLQPELQTIEQNLKILRDYENQVLTDSNINPKDKKERLNNIETQRRDMLRYLVNTGADDDRTTRYIQQLREQAGFNE